MTVRSNLLLVSMTLGALGIALATSIQGQSSPVAQNVQPMFSITISTPHDVIKAGTNVFVKVALTNTSKHQIRLNSSNGTQEMQDIVIRDDQGNSPLSKIGRDIAAGRDWLVGSEHSFTIEPGKTVTERVGVPSTYDLSQPGKYTMQVQKRDPYSKTVVKSNTITLTVTP